MALCCGCVCRELALQIHDVLSVFTTEYGGEGSYVNRTRTREVLECRVNNKHKSYSLIVLSFEQ